MVYTDTVHSNMKSRMFTVDKVVDLTMSRLMV